MAKKYGYDTFTLQTPKVFNSPRNYGYPYRAFKSKFLRPVVFQSGVLNGSQKEDTTERVSV